MREAKVYRKTKETKIRIKLVIDGNGNYDIQSDIGFLNHMLETFCVHGLFDIDAEIKGDIYVDKHHTVEDVGIALGKAFKLALGDKLGINRAGFFICPMDDTLVMTAIDISGRPYLKFDAKYKNKKVGDMPTELVEDFFQGFVSSLMANLHIKVYYGRSDHHKIEAIFKSFAKAMKEACKIEGKALIPGVKEVL